MKKIFSSTHEQISDVSSLVEQQGFILCPCCFVQRQKQHVTIF